MWQDGDVAGDDRIPRRHGLRPAHGAVLGSRRPSGLGMLVITWWRDRRWRREIRRVIAEAQEKYRTGVWKDT